MVSIRRFECVCIRKKTVDKKALRGARIAVLGMAVRAARMR